MSGRSSHDDEWDKSLTPTREVTTCSDLPCGGQAFVPLIIMTASSAHSAGAPSHGCHNPSYHTSDGFDSCSCLRITSYKYRMHSSSPPIALRRSASLPLNVSRARAS